jgi:uncharacterized delta-60 repeat protein/uncharacterized repeat protein (TIGR01451 family)
MNKIYKQLLLAYLLLFSINLLHAQVGVYDAGFGTGGKVFHLFSDVDAKPSAVALQPDGRIVVGGTGDDFPGGIFRIVRYNTNGTPDATFGSGGIFTHAVASGNDIFQTLAVQPDGKIVAGGVLNVFDAVSQQTDEDFYIFRLKTDGTFDSTFGINGLVTTDLNAHSNDVMHELIIKPDGKILAGGYSMDMNNGDNYYGLVQYKDNGNRDSSFGTNGMTVLPLPQQEEGKGALALLPNGQIIAATTVVNDTSFFYEFGLLRFNANGSLDAGFGEGGVVHLGLSYFHSIVRDMAVQTDGKIVLTGQTNVGNASGIAVVRVNGDGTYDLTFGDNGVVRTHISEEPFDPDTGNTLVIQPDKKIIIGCTLVNAINSTEANFAVVRYLPNGDIDPNFGRQGIIITDFNENGDFSIASLQQPDGKFVLVGSTESAFGETGFGIVRYLSDARFYYNTLKGSVFYDDNANGVKDGGEDFFANAVVAAQKPGIDTLTITTSTGLFSVEVDTGNYVIRPQQPAGQPPYFTVIPGLRTTSHNSYFNTDSVSFAMQPIPGMRDIFVYVIPLNPARPGFPTDYMIVYGNNGTDSVAAGTVKFVPSSLVDVTSSEPAASSVNGDTLLWNYVNLYPRDTSFIIVHATIQPPPAVNIGDTLISYAFITPVGLDQQPKNNAFILKEVVVGSFDPNDKSESHAGQVSPAQLNAGEYLQYMIRFQNTGTDTAFNVYVRDTLQSNLDWSTMEMVIASHPYKLVMDNGVCLWSFNNIALVDSTHNEPNSHGYIVFRIRPLAGLVAGNQITNSAAIYFDYNLPVPTNIETTTILSAPVPVTLLHFSAKKNGKTNLLSWSTVNEMNADRFDIERSGNGSSFEKNGTVQCQPGTAGTKFYEYRDESPLAKRNYYRLKIVDYDGRFTYSPVRLLSSSRSDYFRIYPNPVRNLALVEIESEKKDALQAQVLTYDGKLLISTMWNVEQGKQLRSINSSGLPAGNYLLKIVSMASPSQDDQMQPVVLKFEKL